MENISAFCNVFRAFHFKWTLEWTWNDFREESYGTIDVYGDVNYETLDEQTNNFLPSHEVPLNKQNLHKIIPKVITVNNNMIQSFSAYLASSFKILLTLQNSWRNS